MSYQDKHFKRLLESFSEMSEQDQDKFVDTVQHDSIMQAVNEVAKSKTSYFGDLYAEAVERQKTFFTFEGLQTGMQYFDDAMMGLRPGETIVIAGPSNLGKTMVSLNIIAQTVVNTGAKALIISMEMPDIDIASRLYNMTNDHNSLMENVIIQTELDVNIQHIEAMIKRHKPDIVMIDHIQFLANQDKQRTEYERINTTTKKVQRLAVKNKIPIIIISHVAKTRGGKDGRASAADLKGSSAIEQDSDIVFMLNRSDEQRQTGELTIELVKHRKKGSKVYYKPVTLFFDNVKLSGNYQPEYVAPKERRQVPQWATA